MNESIRCPFCGSPMIWGADFNYDEFYGEGEGIVSTYACSNVNCTCSAEFSLRTGEEE